MTGARRNHTENIMDMSREQVIQELDALEEAYDPDAPIEELRALAIAANVRDSFRRMFGPEVPSPEESRVEEVLVEPGSDDIPDVLPDDPHVETDDEIASNETSPIEEPSRESDDSLLETEEENLGCWNSFKIWWSSSSSDAEDEESQDLNIEADNDVPPDMDISSGAAIIGGVDEITSPDFLESVEPPAEPISLEESDTEPDIEVAPIEELEQEPDGLPPETEEENPGCWNSFKIWWSSSSSDAGDEGSGEEQDIQETGSESLLDIDSPANDPGSQPGVMDRISQFSEEAYAEFSADMNKLAAYLSSSGTSDDQTDDTQVPDSIEDVSTEAPDIEESHVPPAEVDTPDSQPDEISDEPIMPDQSVETSEEETTSLTEDLNQLIALASAKISAMQVAREENKATKLQSEAERTQITETGTKPVPGKYPPAFVRDQGQYLDGWADVIEDRGGMAKEVQDLFFEILTERQMPDIRVSRGDIDHSEFRINQSRFYTLATTHPNGTTYIYVGNHGQDLFVSWRTFVRPVTNLRTIFTIMGISAFVAAVIGFFSNEAGIYYYFPGLYSSALPICFGLTFGVSALGLAYLYSLAGKISHGDAGYHFVRQPTLFDIDDFSAMSISVHKSLLAALERVGVEADLISTKQEFSTVRKGQNL